MARKKRPQTYPKEGQEDLKDTIQKLRSQVRHLQKELKEVKSENKTLLDAWAKTECFLQEITDGVPLEEVIKYKKLPKKAVRKGGVSPETKEETRKKWAKWRKEKL